MRLHVEPEDGHLYAVSVTSDLSSVQLLAIDLLLNAGARGVSEIKSLRDSWGALRWFVDVGDIFWLENRDQLAGPPAVACELKVPGLVPRERYRMLDHSIGALQREITRTLACEAVPKPDRNARAEDLRTALDVLMRRRAGRAPQDVFAEEGRAS